MSRERYRVFSRRWWKDKACTVPGAGRKTTIEIVYGEEAAQALCRSHNRDETAIASAGLMARHGNMKGFDMSKDSAPLVYRRGRTDYEAIRDLASDPAQLGAIVTAEEHDEMLGCVPPRYIKGAPGFLVGEPLTGDARGTVYANYYVSADGHYCARYHCVEGE